MRFMLLMIPAGYETAAPDTMPDDAARVEEMMKFNIALEEAGVLLACDGLHPPSSGARVTFKSGKPIITDGPFAETKEVLGGYWIIDVPSQADAVAWAARCPGSDEETIEVRRIQEISDYNEEIQALTAEMAPMQMQTGKNVRS